MSKILFSLLLILSSFVEQHEYYLSTSTLKWVPDNKQIQLTSRFFLDDIEALMQAKKGAKIVFLPDSDPVAIDAFVKDFYLTSLAIELDGQKQEINYLGREYSDDLMIIYAEVLTDTSEFSSIEITADFLVDFLAGQQNIFHLSTPHKKKSFLLSQTKTAVNYPLQ